MFRVALIGWLAGCSGKPAETGSDPETDTDTDTEVAWSAPDGGVIQLATRDGVELEADYYPGAEKGARSVILLHMIPPSNTRADWPAPFIEALTAHGWSVIAVDRRGAGGSGGNAQDAYQGEKGRYDVEACAVRLRSDGYGDPVIIGASNGTTSMIDYAVWAPGEGLPEPVAFGFMTGGTYTESQTAMEDIPKIPAFFTYSTEERQWSEAQRPLDPGTWGFFEYADGAHGTRMFDVAPQVTGDIDGFLSGI